jgi:hypothetical protein
MEDVLLTLARVSAGLFTGAALYVAFVEQPTRLESRSSVALAQFRTSIRRAEKMQPTLLFVCLAAGLASFVSHPSGQVLLGLALLAVIVPLTVLLLLPINRRLCRSSAEELVPVGMQLVKRWGALHAFRATLALAGTALLHG